MACLSTLSSSHARNISIACSWQTISIAQQVAFASAWLDTSSTIRDPHGHSGCNPYPQYHLLFPLLIFSEANTTTLHIQAARGISCHVILANKRHSRFDRRAQLSHHYLLFQNLLCQTLLTLGAVWRMTIRMAISTSYLLLHNSHQSVLSSKVYDSLHLPTQTLSGTSSIDFDQQRE